MSTGTNVPLYATLTKIAAIWAAANIAYYTVLPLLGIDLSYNLAPFALGGYFLFWIFVTLFTFSDTFRSNLLFEKKLWVYAVMSLVYGTLIFGSLYLLSELPVLHGRIQVPYSDVLFAPPLYFIPKSLEVLLQQFLIAALVIALSKHTSSLRSVAIWYAALFGGAHILLYSLSDAPTPYAFAVTVGSLASSLIFPFLILRIRSGFVHSYVLHISFYIAASLLLHTWPPPGYFPI